MTSPGARTVDCPACGRPAPFGPANPWRPFCSQRCKTLDLGAWASDRYVVGGSPLEDAVDPADAGADLRSDRARGQ